MEHADNYHRFLLQKILELALAARLRIGGKRLLYVPAFGLLFSAMDHAVGHHRRYQRAGLVSLVRQAGLSVESAGYVDSLGFLVTLVYKAVSRRAGRISVRAVRTYDRTVFPVSRRLDPLFSRWAGKNLLLIARRGETS
jgi:hypothetical protein